MATITFTAQVPGTEDAPITRSSGTMPYVAYAGGTWHKSFAAAYKAAKDRYHAPGTKVYPVVPTQFNGKVTPEWEATKVDGWGDIPAAAMAEVIEAKTGKTAAPVAEVVAEAIEIEAEVAEQVADEAPAKEVRYLASRDSRGARTDEDAAMAHARIYAGSDLAEAQQALYAYMLKEVSWLTGSMASPVSLRRAADILEAADQARALAPEEGKPWSKAEVVTQTGDTVALVWSIVRIER